MNMILASGSNYYTQFIAVLLIFVLVLGATAFVTKWIANYQKKQGENGNIQVIETTRISNNKYIQIVRVGDKNMVIAICKDTVTMLGEVSAEQLKDNKVQNTISFKQLLEKTLKKDSENSDIPKE